MPAPPDRNPQSTSERADATHCATLLGGGARLLPSAPCRRPAPGPRSSTWPGWRCMPGPRPVPAPHPLSPPFGGRAPAHPSVLHPSIQHHSLPPSTCDCIHCPVAWPRACNRFRKCARTSSVSKGDPRTTMLAPIVKPAPNHVPTRTDSPPKNGSDRGSWELFSIYPPPAIPMNGPISKRNCNGE